MLLVSVSQLSNAARFAYKARTVSQLKAQLSDIKSKESALMSAFAPKPPPPTEAPWVWVLDPDAALKYNGAPTEARHAYAALAARESVISHDVDGLQRAHGEAEDSVFNALVSGAVGLLAWVLAYVLGGSFWKPPANV